MKVMALGDWHCPALDLKMLAWAKKIFIAEKCDLAVMLGDLVDGKAWSRFDKPAEDDSPALEWKKTVQQVEKASKIFKKLEIINGNHDLRIIKKSVEAKIPRQLIKELHEIFDFPGWDFHIGPKPLIIDKVAYVHGDEIVATRGNKCIKYGMSIVQGHTHQAALTYVQTFDNSLFECEAGFMGIEEHPAFSYAAKNPRRGWKGVVIVDNGVNVRFIRYPG